MSETTPDRRGATHARITVPMVDVEVRDSGSADGGFTIRGYAAVFDRLSLDLGGFREKVDQGAFERVLDAGPSVLIDWDHDTRYVLGSTANGTLELRETPQGLHYWCRVAPTSYAADLRVLLERGDISQASFMFTIERERWEEDADGNITATIEEVRDLFDVTVTARGAYPQTDSSLANSADLAAARGRLDKALQEGRVQRTAPGDDSQPDEAGDATKTPDAEPDGSGSDDAAAETPDVANPETETTSDGQEDATRAFEHALAQSRRRRAEATKPR